MAKSTSKSQLGDGTLQSSDVPDQVVSQVGRAAMEIVKLRQSFEENLATARTEEERETLTNQVEVAVLHAVGEQGLSVDKYNEVIAAAQSDPDLEERVLIACKAV